MIVAIEGLDRSGKTTLINYLQTIINDANQTNRFVFTKETDFSANLVNEPIKHHLSNFLLNPNYGDNFDQLSRNLCFALLRAHHDLHVVQPALKQAKTVIIDRYIHSSFAYTINETIMNAYWNHQIEMGLYQDRQAIINHLLEIYHFSSYQKMPDLVFYLSVPIYELQARHQRLLNSWSVSDYQADAIEKQYDQDFQKWTTIHEEYLRAFEYVVGPDYAMPKIIILDGLLQPQQLAQQVYQAIVDYQNQKQINYQPI